MTGRRRLLVPTLAGLAAALSLLCLLAPAAEADFNYVIGGLNSQHWATAPGPNAYLTRNIGGLVVRPDGAVIVSAPDGLHLLPPGGGVISPANRFGRPGLDAYQLLMWRGELWASVQETTPWAPCFIHELDPSTGAEIHQFSWSQCLFPSMAVDPRTGELELPGLVRTACSPCSKDRHPLQEWDPLTGRVATLLEDPPTPYAATSFSPDGSVVYVSEVLLDPAPRTMYIDAYRRGEGVAIREAQWFRMALPNFSTAYSMSTTASAACLRGSLLYTDLFADLYQVPDPSPKSRTSHLLATTPLMPGPVRYATLAGTLAPGPGGGLFVVAYNNVSTVNCAATPAAASVGTPTPPHLFQVSTAGARPTPIPVWVLGLGALVVVVVVGRLVILMWRQWERTAPDPWRQR